METKGRVLWRAGGQDPPVPETETGRYQKLRHLRMGTGSKRGIVRAFSGQPIAPSKEERVDRCEKTGCVFHEPQLTAHLNILLQNIMLWVTFGKPRH